MYTAIVTARANEPYLSEAIESILGQTLSAARVMVAVGPDAEPNCETVRTVAQFPDDVSLVRSPDAGMIGALNTALGLTFTPFVAFLDSDDLWTSMKQEQQIEILQSNRQVHLASSKAANFRVETDGHHTVLKVSESILFTASTFRTEVFRSFGPIDPQSTHHTWLYRWWADALQHGITRQSTGEIGVMRRIHNHNSWVTDNARAHKELRSELRRLFSQKTPRTHT